MITAKIIRHRHKFHHYVNDDLKAISEDLHYKIVFSHPAEMDLFKKWCVERGGEYNYNKEKNEQEGKLPAVEGFEGEDICWCDIMTYFLLTSGYKFHSALSPYKGEVYVK